MNCCQSASRVDFFVNTATNECWKCSPGRTQTLTQTMLPSYFGPFNSLLVNSLLSSSVYMGRLLRYSSCMELSYCLDGAQKHSCAWKLLDYKIANETLSLHNKRHYSLIFLQRLPWPWGLLFRQRKACTALVWGLILWRAERPHWKLWACASTRFSFR